MKKDSDGKVIRAGIVEYIRHREDTIGKCLFLVQESIMQKSHLYRFLRVNTILVADIRTFFRKEKGPFSLGEIGRKTC